MFPVAIEYDPLRQQIVLATQTDIRFFSIEDGQMTRLLSQMAPEGEEIT